MSRPFRHLSRVLREWWGAACEACLLPRMTPSVCFSKYRCRVAKAHWNLLEATNYIQHGMITSVFWLWRNAGVPLLGLQSLASPAGCYLGAAAVSVPGTEPPVQVGARARLQPPLECPESSRALGLAWMGCPWCPVLGSAAPAPGLPSSTPNTPGNL